MAFLDELPIDVNKKLFIFLSNKYLIHFKNLVFNQEIFTEIPTTLPDEQTIFLSAALLSNSQVLHSLFPSVIFVGIENLSSFLLNSEFNEIHCFLHANEINSCIADPSFPDDFKKILQYKYPPSIQKLHFDPNSQFILHYKKITQVELPFPDCHNCKNFDRVKFLKLICPGEINDADRCPNCGAALFQSQFAESCCLKNEKIRSHLISNNVPPDIIKIIEEGNKAKPNFTRAVNYMLKPIIQKANISNPNGGGSTIHIYGVPYAIDSKEQFVQPVYLIFNGGDSFPDKFKGNFYMVKSLMLELASKILKLNPTLKSFLLNVYNRFGDSFSTIQASLLTKDNGINFALFSNDSLIEGSSQTYVTVDNERLTDDQQQNLDNYEKRYINELSAEYDHLIFPLMFWDGQGGCGIFSNETIQTDWDIKMMKRICVCLCMQPQSHYFHKLISLREEYICTVYGRWMKYKVENEKRRQMSVRLEKEIRSGTVFSSDENDHGITTFIPASFTSSPSYWKQLQNKAFLLTVLLGPPTFFMTITMNPHWPEVVAICKEESLSNSSLLMRVFRQRKLAMLQYIRKSKIFGQVKGMIWRDEYQKRGLPHSHLLIWSDFDTDSVSEINKVINCQLPRSKYYEQLEENNMIRELITKYETHSHSKRCRKDNKLCCFGYPKKPRENTELINDRYEFARGEEDVMIVPHNPTLLLLYRAHMEIEPVYSKSCLGYVLKYTTKDSDNGDVYFFQQNYWCGAPISKNDILMNHYSKHISPGPEVFSFLAGYGKSQITPTVIMKSIHLPGERLIYSKKNASKEEIEESLENSMSPLERYFARPDGEVFDGLTFCEYYSQYSFSSKPTRNSIEDKGSPQSFITKRSNDAICGISNVLPSNRELFSLRILLNFFPFRSFDEARTVDGVLYDSFSEACQVRGLIASNMEFATAIDDAIAQKRTPADIRFLVALAYKEGENWKELVDLYHDHMSADLDEDVPDALMIELTKLFAKMSIAIPISMKQFLDLDQPMNVEDPVNDIDISVLNERQKIIFDQVINNVMDSESGHLMFLQGRAGTGKTFLTNCIISQLRKSEKSVLICGTTGIAAAQYPDGCTVHSMFGLGIDQKRKGAAFKSNIGAKTYKGRMLLNANLLIIDEVSMLTTDVAEAVDLTLRSLWLNENYPGDLSAVPPFAGKNVLFVGDFLQLPPVIPNNYGSVMSKLITKCSWWPIVELFGLNQPMRAPDEQWSNFIYHIGNGELPDGITRWSDIPEITVTTDFDEAVQFYLQGIEDLTDNFPLDRLWIVPTNFYGTKTNEYFHHLREEILPPSKILGKIHAFTEIDYEIPEKYHSELLTDSQKFDFVSNWKFHDLPDPVIEFHYGEPMILMRNLNTKEGIVKNKRCWVQSITRNTVTVKFDNNVVRTIPRISFKSETNGIKFTRKQIPLKHVFAGTVHKSQGMTLGPVVLDLRSDFWEHGQLYVGLSRVKSPRDICILLNKKPKDEENSNENTKDDDSNLIKPVADMSVVQFVTSIEADVVPEVLADEEANISEENEPHEKSIARPTHTKELMDFFSSSSDLDEPEDYDADIPEEDEKIASVYEAEISEAFPFMVFERNRFLLNHTEEGMIENMNGSYNGLFNFGLTCYINSVLIMLYHVEELRSYYLSKPQAISREFIIFNELFSALSTTFQLDYHYVAVRPNGIISFFNIDISKDGDVHEFLLQVAKYLNTDCFMYESVQQIQHNDQSTSQANPVKDFVLSINAVQDSSVQNEIDKLTNEIECEDGNKMSYLFFNFNSYLLVSIGRYDKQSPDKNNAKFEVSHELNICGCSFTLKSVIVHHGQSQRYGHFTTMVRIDDKTIIEYNDTKVFQITIDRFNELSAGNEEGSAVFALYYKNE